MLPPHYTGATRMIDQLLAKFRTPRRHMAFLVGLLALVLVLTAVVAWRASEADRERVNMANAALDEAARMTLGAWSDAFRVLAGSLLMDIAPAMAGSSRTLESMSLQDVARLICEVCTSTGGVVTVFTLDTESGATSSVGADVQAGVAEHVRMRLLSGQSTLLTGRTNGGFYFMDVDGVAVAAIAYLADGDDVTSRITGAVLSQPMSIEMVDFAFHASRANQGAYAPEESSDRLFERAMLVDDVVMWGGITGSGEIVTTIDGPVYGITLKLRPLDAGLFARRPGSAAERTTIFLLMVVISALLITAMFQVRRDATLTRLRADFVASVTHELRTPLAQIRMFTETLLLGRVRSDIERRRSLEIIDQEARRLTHLVENVLLFAKSEGGRRTRVEPEPTQFTDEIRHAVESLSLLCRNRSAEVRTELQDGINVPVDRMALRQIMVNLVDNALKYGPSGQRITVGAALFDDVARVWVDDEGPGIPEADREQVFESFYRLPRESQARVTGSGIGLAVVRELAVLHGGRAWAEDAPGRGARIVVEFPDAYLRTIEAAHTVAAAS